MPEKPKGGTFRIGDLRRPEVRGSRTGRPPEPVPEHAPSVGFPSIERWLEAASIEEVVGSMRPRYEALEKLSTGGNLKEKGTAKKAMAAYERAADLFEYLFETKDALTGGDNA